MKRFCAALVAVGLSATSASAAARIDVDNLFVPPGRPWSDAGLAASSFIDPYFSISRSGGYMSQTWTIGSAGRFDRLDIVSQTLGIHQKTSGGFYDQNADFMVKLSVSSGATAFTPGWNELASLSLMASDVVDYGITSFDFSAFDLHFAQGEMLTWRVSVEACPEMYLCSQSWGSSHTFNGREETNGYEGGMGFTENEFGLHAFPRYDLNFRTWMSAVPEPDSWALMILGFGGAGVAIRRRRRELRFS